MNIENRLTLLLAENPRAPWATLVHDAAEEIVRLRAKVIEAEGMCLSYAHRSGYAQGALYAICHRTSTRPPEEIAKNALERVGKEYPITPKEDQPDGSKKR